VRGERIKEKDTMTFSIFPFINVLFNVSAIGAGVTVLFGLLTGKLFSKWSIWFLETSLLASITSLNFSTHNLRPAEEASVLAVYLAGAAILAWRKYHLAGVWSSVFAATATMILYLNVFVAIGHAFGHTFLVTQVLVAALFLMLGALAIKRFHAKPIQSF
jgi:hypothetical protein